MVDTISIAGAGSRYRTQAKRNIRLSKRGAAQGSHSKADKAQ